MNAERSAAMREFLDGTGWGAAALSPLPADASTRRYSRLRLDGRSALFMDQPPNAETPRCPPAATPEERRGLGYNAVARLAGANCRRFVATAEFLRSKGLSSPSIYAADTDLGFAVIEDFGDDLYASVLANGTDERTLYEAAIDALVKLQAEPAPASLANGEVLQSYDETALLAETDLMTEWFMPAALGRGTAEDERLEHRSLWRDALLPVLASPRVFVHRDYHAQNLFWLPERKVPANVGMIDFQDAVAGAASYDPISLLEDARRDVSPALAEAAMQRYIAGLRRSGFEADEESYRAEAAVMAAQRNAKIAGIFARLSERDGKPRYLSYLPRVWGYLDRDLEHAALRPLKAWYDRHIPVDARRSARVRESA